MSMSILPQAKVGALLKSLGRYEESSAALLRAHDILDAKDARGSDYAAACNNAGEALFLHGPRNHHTTASVHLLNETGPDQAFLKGQCAGLTLFGLRFGLAGKHEQAVELFEKAYQEMVAVGALRCCGWGSKRIVSRFSTIAFLPTADEGEPDLDSVDVPISVAVTLRNLSLALGTN